MVKVLSMMNNKYKLLDSGEQKRLECIGPYKIIRPCAQAIWSKKHPDLWSQADLIFTRQDKNLWQSHRKIPENWQMIHKDVIFKISPTQFGHIGVFPEHLDQLISLKPLIKKEMKILNLFAYTGAASIYFAKLGAKVTHLDASKTSVAWAKENAQLNDLEDRSIRWIVDDALKFLKREVKRNMVYDGVILDPPSYGKGSSSQVFVIEKDIQQLLDLCQKVLSNNPSFVFFSCHTPGFTKQTMQYLMEEHFSRYQGDISSGEMLIEAEETYDLPSGTYGLWRREC